MASKRAFHVIISVFMRIILSPAMIVVSIAIVLDSKGGELFRQERITQYGKKFRIYKFRTMVDNAEQLGMQATVKNDMRITKVGGVLRKLRIDNFPQLLNIMVGDMTFVGVGSIIVTTKKNVDFSRVVEVNSISLFGFVRGWERQGQPKSHVAS